jgi:putative DNA primase/helicase
VLEPIGEFADRLGIAVLSITHFSKSGVGSATKALHRFIGSIAFVGAPRIALAVIEEDGRYLLLHAKNNLAPPPSGLAYKIESALVGPAMIESSRVVWDATHVSISADEAINAKTGRDAPDREDAEGFLRELLANGPLKQTEVKDAADGHLHTWATIRRAANKLGIKPKKEEGRMDGAWLWKLPSNVP